MKFSWKLRLLFANEIRKNALVREFPFYSNIFIYTTCEELLVEYEESGRGLILRTIYLPNCDRFDCMYQCSKRMHTDKQFIHNALQH